MSIKRKYLLFIKILFLMGLGYILINFQTIYFRYKIHFSNYNLNELKEIISDQEFSLENFDYLLIHEDRVDFLKMIINIYHNRLTQEKYYALDHLKEEFWRNLKDKKKEEIWRDPLIELLISTSYDRDLEYIENTRKLWGYMLDSDNKELRVLAASHASNSPKLMGNALLSVNHDVQEIVIDNICIYFDLNKYKESLTKISNLKKYTNSENLLKKLYDKHLENNNLLSELIEASGKKL